ncbi:MAG: hypothetical protein ABUS49_04400 [Acidobacteriota bacterium]
MPNSRTVVAALLGAILALSSAVPALAAGPGFRTQHMLEEHYAKYGRAFGKITQDRYLRLAQQLRDARPGKNVLAVKMASGGAKFDRRYGWFVAYDNDGTLRTFFVPKEGIRYFARQGGNRAPPE